MRPGGRRRRSITGHIDFLQVRNDAVHILDYKPDARTNKPIAQLAIYALALTIRVPGLKLVDINVPGSTKRNTTNSSPARSSPRADSAHLKERSAIRRSMMPLSMSSASIIVITRQVLLASVASSE